MVFYAELFEYIWVTFIRIIKGFTQKLGIWKLKELTALRYKVLIDLAHIYETHNKETDDSKEAGVRKLKT